MYTIAPPAVYAHETVMANSTFRARVDRVVAALKEPREIIPYTDADLPEMIREHGLLNRSPMRRLAEIRDPILLFNTFRFDAPEAARSRADALGAQGLNAGHDLLGTGAFIWFNANLEGDPNRNDKVCRPCWRIHLQRGCLHKCSYCSLGGLLVSMVNVEEYCQHLGTLIARHPWQTTYLLDDDADPPGLEPELGVLGPLMEFFGTLEERYLIIHTKTWNTAWMKNVRHRGNTIIVWSISGSTQSRLIEPDTGTTEQRVEAARLAQQAGIQIRYKFKPIVPVRNWRRDAEESIRLVFEKTDPDVISLCCFMWTHFSDLDQHLDVDLLDPDFLEAARKHEPEMRHTMARPFPFDVRKEIYEFYLREIRRYSKDVPVSLSTENFRMWNALTDVLGSSATSYVCGCGPQSTPGKKRLECHPFKVAVRHDAGIPGVAVPGVP